MQHDKRTNNTATGIIGTAQVEPSDEADHFYVCVSCGQAVDKRDLGQVFHHENNGHEPLSEN